MRVKTSFRELFKRHPGNPIITINDWPYPVNSAFNCGATLLNGQTVLLVRVEDRTGLSHLAIAKSTDGVKNWKIESKPALFSEPEKYPEEIWGVEDPRITYIPELKEYYITYTAFSRGGPLVSLAKTADFKTFDKIGAVLPPENKDAALFPVRFNNQWAVIHRPAGSIMESGHHIWIALSPDLVHWGKHRILLMARTGAWWDAGKVGISPPPLRIPEGWLVLYHGVKKTAEGALYRLGLALLDLNDPTKLIRRANEWVMGPSENYERQGDVNNVVFPCGWILENDQVRLYYGSADTSIALAIAHIKDLRDYILQCPKVKEPELE